MSTRVWCLYRVSTKKQANTDEDIPMQKSACEYYVSQKEGWEITYELYERGISGWKKKVDERDALNEIREGAVNGKFDVLLVYMFDRLGRREDETPLVVNFLHENNVDVWSVEEGKKSMGSHVDKLINYISFWQSSGESIKTSMRVRESKKQLSQNGMFQGGAAPFGYKIVETDQPHWKNQDRMIKVLMPDDYESEVVKLIYNLYLNYGYGYRRIVEHLNSKGYKNRNDSEFRTNLIKRILSNPIFIGRKRYKSHDGEDGDTQPYNEDLRVISDDTFYEVQKLMEKKSNSLKPQDKSNLPMKGKLLLSGQAYCGYCGSKLSGNYLYRKNQNPNKPNEYYTNTVYRYRCPLNSGKGNHKQNIWGSKKYDKMAIKIIKDFFNNMSLNEMYERTEKNIASQIKIKKENLRKLKNEINTLRNKKDKLDSEIAQSLLGESSFTPEQLSQAINKIKDQIEDKEEMIKQLEYDIEKDESNSKEIEEVVDLANNFNKYFDGADDDNKKILISKVTEKYISIKMKYMWILIVDLCSALCYHMRKHSVLKHTT